MTCNVDEIFKRILSTCNIKNLKELSLFFGYKENWASNTRTRGVIPWEICLKVAIEHNLSMDYLLFGGANNSNSLDVNKLKLSITEGLFYTIQAELISLKNGVKISTVTNAITNEIIENNEIETTGEVNKATKTV
ncbi:MAG: hypothetical protein HRT53_20995 [Colwellia sp.]|nr:hypothetical protein [Colwellia sp.]